MPRVYADKGPKGSVKKVKDKAIAVIKTPRKVVVMSKSKPSHSMKSKKSKY